MVLDLKEGLDYSQKEVAEKMGIKPNTFSKNRDAYQEHLANFCEFEVNYSTKPHKYHIIKNYNIDYYKRTQKMNKKLEVISEKLLKLNHENPISTAARGARKISKDPEIIALGLTSGTLEEYSRISTNKLYGKRSEKNPKGTHGWIDHEVLVYLDKETDDYIELTDEQQNEYFSLIAKGQGDFVVDGTKMFDRFMEKKKHTKEEREEFNMQLAGLNSRIFIEAKKKFKEKYGGTPFWACYYKHFDTDKKIWYNNKE